MEHFLELRSRTKIIETTSGGLRMLVGMMSNPSPTLPLSCVLFMSSVHPYIRSYDQLNIRSCFILLI